MIVLFEKEAALRPEQFASRIDKGDGQLDNFPTLQVSKIQTQ